MHGMYFESAGLILALITLGKFFEARAKGHTTGAISALMNLAPKTAILVNWYFHIFLNLIIFRNLLYDFYFFIFRLLQT